MLHGAKQFLALSMVLCSATLGFAESPVDPALPVYTRVEGVKGKITLIGSDTIAQVAAVWGDSFRKLYPEVEIDVRVMGSENAIPAVTNGTATFGLLSRQPNQTEVQDFYNKFGYPPTVLTPATEAIAVFVHKDNPVTSITPMQLRALFAAQPSPKGDVSTIRSWGEVGAPGQWKNAPVVVHGRSATTGSQVFFQSLVLGGGQFRADMASDSTNLDLVKAVGADPRAIGFAGFIYSTPEVKPLSLVYQPGADPVDIHTPGYPLVRPLQLVVNKNPTRDLSPLEQEFLKFAFSQRGQADVVISGFTPVQSEAARFARAAVGLRTLN